MGSQAGALPLREIAGQASLLGGTCGAIQGIYDYPIFRFRRIRGTVFERWFGEITRSWGLVQETVETVSPVLTIPHTWLKPGANKKGVPAVAASFNLHTFL